MKRIIESASLQTIMFWAREMQNSNSQEPPSHLDIYWDWVNVKEVDG